MTKKVVINKCYGGFGLSEEAMRLYKQKANLSEDNNIYDYELERDDPFLVEVVEELGEDANTPWSYLKVIELPENLEYYIEEYDGAEHIAERHRTWK